MATTKAIAIGTTTTIAATGVVGYGVSQVIANSNEEAPNSNPQVQETTEEKITNRQKIVNSKFTLPATDKENCKERLDGIFDKVNENYKKLVKECANNVTLRVRAFQLSLNASPNRKQKFSDIETSLERLTKLKEKYVSAKGTSNSNDYSKINDFCHQAGKISIQDFSSIEDIENSWTKYLEICSTSQPKNFWVI